MATQSQKELLMAFVLVTTMMSNVCPKAKAQIGFSDFADVIQGISNVMGEKYCGLTIPELLACKPAVQEKKAPSKDCCASVKKADLNCLCDFKDNSLVARWGIDIALAVALPASCHADPKFHC